MWVETITLHSSPYLFLCRTSCPGWGGCGQRHALAALSPWKRPGTHCTVGWVGPTAGLDGSGKPRPHRDPFPGPFSPQRVAKFYSYLYLVFFTQLPEYHGLLHAVVVHILHLLVGRNHSSPNSVYIFLCFAIWVTLSVFHNSRPNIWVAETMTELHVGIFIFVKCSVLWLPPVPQHSHDH